MPGLNYTETDFQDYATGNFSGDKEKLEDFLSKNEYARKQVIYYSVLHRALGKEIIPATSFDLAERVLNSLMVLEEKERAGEWRWKTIPLIALGVIFILALAVTVKYLLQVYISEILKNGIFWISVLILVIFVFLFYYAEFRRTIHMHSELFDEVT